MPENEGVFRFKPNGATSWYTKNVSESNQFCLYCGAFVGSGSSTPSNKEHLIARNFVPKGSLGGPGFNFLFRACVDCNRRKADAERHVSTVTLFNSPERLENTEIDAIARRKASRDFHPGRRGQLVQDAYTNNEIRGDFAGAHFTFTLTAPPQVELEAARLLACNQVQALFALVTVADPRDAKTVKLLAAANWHCFGIFAHNDWGNPQLLQVCGRARAWPLRLAAIAANGCFKVVMRRSDIDEEGWFWALEWNGFLRVVGAIYLPNATPPIFENLPALAWHESPDGRQRYREELGLRPEDDDLFSFGDFAPA